MEINSFSEDFRFLSNFYDSPFRYQNVVYPTNEHFYQAMKTVSHSERKRLAAIPSPGRVKREGHKLEIRKDWDSIKIRVMREGLRLKFKEGTTLAEMLKATHPATLIEANHWGDHFWGVSSKTGQGNNWLGNLLMERRAILLGLPEKAESKQGDLQ